MVSLVTRCPACATLFKVVPDQLRISEGWVRCGQCDEVFDAQAQMQAQVVAVHVAAPGHAAEIPSAAQSLAPPPPPPPIGVEALPPCDVLPLSATTNEVPAAEPQAQALLAVPDVDSLRVEADGAEDAGTDAEPVPQWEETVFTEPMVPNPVVTNVEDAHVVQASFLQRMPQPSSGRLRWLAWLAVSLLGLALAGQVVVQQRDRIAATEPALTAALNALCQPVGCRVAPLQQIESIVIESSSFIKVRADVYRLSFSIRNTSQVPLALPSAELALTDLRDQSVLRRVLVPAEYGARSAILGAGEELSILIPVAVKAAGATSEKVTGYRLLVFYP